MVNDIKVFNLPLKISSELEIKNKNFINELEKIFEKHKVSNTPELQKVKIAVVYNLNLGKNFRFQFNSNIYLYVDGMPKKVSEVDDNSYTNFKVRLDLLIKKVNIQYNGEISRINIILLYNKDFESVKYLNDIIEKSKNNISFANFEGLAFYYPIEPKYSLDKVVLNKEILYEITKTIKLLENKHIIYDEWGFCEIDSAPKAVINFYGPPGTGKTMTAHAIAKELNCKILALNYAEIESKFVGDAPKNLVRAFETAEKENALLFFDEADSFLAKRITNVSSSSDQAFNSLRSQMMILLENFNGYIIFATNLIRNYDRAFETRIFKHLKFELPNEDNRRIIILKHIPDKVPFYQDKKLSKDEINELVKISDGFSGREIKNSILDALSDAICENRKYIKFDDLKNSFNKTKENREKLENEYERTEPVISSEKKKLLEEKIKENLNKNKIEENNNLVSDQKSSEVKNED